MEPVTTYGVNIGFLYDIRKGNDLIQSGFMEVTMKRILTLGLLIMMVIILTGCSNAGSLRRKGEKYFKSGNYEEAAGCFSEAVKANPNRVDYMIDYGMALTALGRYEEALAQFEMATLDKNIVMVRENNKRTLRGKGIVYYQMKQYADAVEQFDAALDIGVLTDLDLDILYYKGDALIALDEILQAEDIYTKIIQIADKDAKAYAGRAYTYQRAGDYEKSLKDYDMAISLDPRCFDYYFGKYSVKMELGDEDGAADVLGEAFMIEEKSKEDHFNLAKVHYLQGMYKQALSEFGESLADGYIESYFYIGEIYGKQLDYSTAIYYYDKYIEEGAATGPFVYNQAASCKMKLGEYEEAISYLEAGERLGEGNKSRILMKNIIIAYENLGDFDAALDKLSKYLTAFPEDEKAMREKEFLLTRQKETDIAD